MLTLSFVVVVVVVVFLYYHLFLYLFFNVVLKYYPFSLLTNVGPKMLSPFTSTTFYQMNLTLLLKQTL